ncbi:MAG: c-type cytochrome [Candidatus Sericytochromatia bacterium]|nr:c-type cytochrome [Candidatus Tanganyikabacteria bacterium]
MRLRAAFALLIAAPLLVAQFGNPAATPKPRPTWDPETNAFIRKGCVACHKFTGTREAVGITGPDLTKVKTRLSKAQVRELLDDPGKFHPGTMMPALDLSRREKELIVRFLWGENRVAAGKPTPRPTVMVFKAYQDVKSNAGKRRSRRR